MVEVAAASTPAYQVVLVAVEPIMVIRVLLVYRVVQAVMVTRRALEQTLVVVEAVLVEMEEMQILRVAVAAQGAPALPLLSQVRQSS